MKTKLSKTSTRNAVASAPEGRWSGWKRRMQSWFRLKKLESEFRNSEDFQRQCEQINCPVLAEYEQDYRNQLRDKIDLLKQTQSHQSLPAQTHADASGENQNLITSDPVKL